MQIELDYITEKLHAIDIDLEDVSRGLILCPLYPE